VSRDKQRPHSPRWLLPVMAVIAVAFALAIWLPVTDFAEAWSLPLATISRYHFDYLQVLLVLPWHWGGVLATLGLLLAARRVK